MKQRHRIYYSAAQRAEIWDRWKAGESMSSIGRRFDREYLPHGTDLSLHSQAQLSAIARQLNQRPRKTLLYRTPAETFADCVAATG